MITEAQLDLFNGRDHKIFDVVLRHFYKAVFLYVNYNTKNEFEAKDITMEVFTGLFIYLEKGNTFDTEDNIKAWLFWTAKNKCIDAWRKQQKQRALTKELEEQSQYPEIDDRQLHNDMQVIDAVIAIVNQLPGKYGQVARLFYFEDLTYAEIADKLNITRNEVSKLKIYSITEIRKRLDNT
jgi:RNA polymerase sigma-70 factor (ECF subfamily)